MLGQKNQVDHSQISSNIKLLNTSLFTSTASVMRSSSSIGIRNVQKNQYQTTVSARNRPMMAMNLQKNENATLKLNNEIQVVNPLIQKQKPRDRSLDNVDLISQSLVRNKMRQRTMQEITEKATILNNQNTDFSKEFNDKQKNDGFKQGFNFQQFNASEKVQDIINSYAGKQYQQNLISQVNKINQTKFKSENNENQFSVSKNEEFDSILKENDNYMDKSLHFSHENVTNSIKQFFDGLKDGENLQQFKKQLVQAAIMLSFTGLGSQQALAVDQQALVDGKQALVDGRIPPFGNVSYSTFIQGVQDHVIERVRVLGNGSQAEFLNIEGQRGFVNLFNDPQLLKILQDNKVDLSVLPTDNTGNFFFGLLSQLAFPLIFFGGLALLSRLRQGPGGPNDFMNSPMNPMNIGKSKAKVQMVPDTGVKFDQVAGVDEAKEELTEIVDFLKQPDRYTELGAKIPRGALLIGPPGTGKTMLAKAVAGEAGVPFISISAAEFIEMFVGVGASRVRDLFKTAKEAAPCIIFIDELDAVGRQRAQGIGMGNDEREQTINQLLTEMDGFEGNKGVIVLAATNIPDVLDKALLRPGRFDRQIRVGLPDQKGRTKILEVHAKDKKMATTVNLSDVAKRCLGMSGADLMNVMNEAAILTARKKKQLIDMEEIYDSIDRIQIGLEKKGSTFSQERMKLVAYHEAGHALLGTLMKEYDLVNKISIVPRGAAGGVTIFTPNEEAMESGMYSKEYLENRICVALGGRIAEEIINGKDKVTTGASNDFQQCTQTAKMMVEQMGMSSIGPRNIAGQQPQFMMMAPSMEGSTLRNRADEEIDRILREQYERGMKLLLDNKNILDAIAKTLIEKEKITGIEMLDLIKQINPDLVTEEAVKAVKEMMKPINGELEPALAQ